MDNESVYVNADYWDWKRFNILSLLIRMLCFGFNHVARRKGNTVYEMKGAKFSWIVRKLLGKPVSYAPNEGSGLTATPYEEWLTHANRKVIELEPLVPLLDREHKAGYGFLDLIQMFLQVVRRVWLMVGNDWNGQDGCRLWEGEFCTEFVGNDYGIPDAHLLAPISYLMMPEYFRKVRQFETRTK